MGSRINPTTIGAFVVSAIVLVIAGVLVFGGGKFFQERLPYVLFFESSVEGLNVGAPVIFRGVQVGQVTAISAIADPKTFNVNIKVNIQLVRGAVKVGEGQRFEDPHQAVQGLIQRGARATLRMQSFVTGLLYVAIDFFPDTPVRLLGLDQTVPELPTIPSTMDQLKSSFEQAMADLRKLPLETIFNKVLETLTRLNALLEAPEIKQGLVALRDVMTDARQLVANADNQIGSLAPKLAGTVEVASKALETMRVTLLDAQKLVRDVDVQVAPLAGGAKETLTSAKDALTAARSALVQAQKSLATLTEAAAPVLKQADRTLAGTTAVMGSDSALLNDLSRTLRAFDEAARAVRTLANSLERNPEMLIRGRNK